MEAATLILALTFIGAGATALIAAVTDARWFFSARGAHAFTGRRRHAASRLIYGVAGTLMIAAGLSLIVG
jgi:hypothetical protein